MINVESVDKVIDIDGTVLVKTTYIVYKSKLMVEYTNPEGKVHRLDGPARTSGSDYFEYWVNGKRHRLDGPARVWSGYKGTYWVDDLQYNEEDYPQAVFEFSLKQMIG